MTCGRNRDDLATNEDGSSLEKHAPLPIYTTVPDSGVMASVGHSKVFILDKYFTELQKFWETEIKLQGNDNVVILLSF